MPWRESSQGKLSFPQFVPKNEVARGQRVGGALAAVRVVQKGLKFLLEVNGLQKGEPHGLNTIISFQVVSGWHVKLGIF